MKCFSINIYMLTAILVVNSIGAMSEQGQAQLTRQLREWREEAKDKGFYVNVDLVEKAINDVLPQDYKAVIINQTEKPLDFLTSDAETQRSQLNIQVPARSYLPIYQSGEFEKTNHIALQVSFEKSFWQELPNFSQKINDDELQIFVFKRAPGSLKTDKLIMAVIRYYKKSNEAWVMGMWDLQQRLR